MLRRFLFALLLVLSSLATLAQKERHFTFHYAFTVKNVSPGEHVRAWIPLAHSDQWQDVKVVAKFGRPGAQGGGPARLRKRRLLPRNSKSR